MLRKIVTLLMVGCLSCVFVQVMPAVAASQAVAGGYPGCEDRSEASRLEQYYRYPAAFEETFYLSECDTADMIDNLGAYSIGAGTCTLVAKAVGKLPVPAAKSAYLGELACGALGLTFAGRAWQIKAADKAKCGITVTTQMGLVALPLGGYKIAFTFIKAEGQYCPPGVKGEDDPGPRSDLPETSTEEVAQEQCGTDPDEPYFHPATTDPEQQWRLDVFTGTKASSDGSTTNQYDVFSRNDDTGAYDVPAGTTSRCAQPGTPYNVVRTAWYSYYKSCRGTSCEQNGPYSSDEPWVASTFTVPVGGSYTFSESMVTDKTHDEAYEIQHPQCPNFIEKLDDHTTGASYTWTVNVFDAAGNEISTATAQSPYWRYQWDYYFRMPYWNQRTGRYECGTTDEFTKTATENSTFAVVAK